MKLTLPLLLLWSIQTAAKPNILFILTDDQGKYMGGLDHMPRLQVISSVPCVNLPLLTYVYRIS